MHPAVEHALNDWRALNDSPSWWARFEAMITEGGQVIVKLEYGVIHSNGLKESTLRSVQYFVNPDGTIGVA